MLEATTGVGLGALIRERAGAAPIEADRVEERLTSDDALATAAAE